jgi:hypothetical protein
MSENEMSQQQRDEELIASMQQHIAKAAYEDPPQGDMFLISTNRRDIIEYALAERRERMRLRAERDRLRAAYDTLRAACDGVSEILDRAASEDDNGGWDADRDEKRNAADALRAAIASAAGDGAE